MDKTKCFQLIVFLQKVFSGSKIYFFLLGSACFSSFRSVGAFGQYVALRSGKVLGTLQGVSMGPLDTQHLLPLDGRNLSSRTFNAREDEDEEFSLTNF